MRALCLVPLLLAATLLATAVCAADTGPADRVAQLEAENARLRADTEFARRRMVLLEQEADRLRAAVKSRQDADDLAAGRIRRQEIEREVEHLRGLRFKQPVDYQEIPRTELPVILRQKLAQQVPDQEFETAGLALAALGVLPAGTDLKKTYLALLGEQVGAFYDQHEKGLFTFTGQPLTASTNRVIMAHELTHALEDQHFDLTRLPMEAKGNDDRVLAATALVEGDATLVMNRYMTGDLSAASLREALGSALTTDVRQLAAAPRYLRETLLFPYLRGQEFCNTLYAHGGWESLNEAFRHPPSSSAQILHPELYLAEPREEPVEIVFSDPEIDGQKPIEDNVLGDFGTRQFLANWLHDKARAETVAAGWRGDRYLVFHSTAGTSSVWKVACRDRAAGESLCEAIREADVTRYHLAGGATAKKALPTSGPSGEPTGEQIEFEAGGRMVELCRTAANEVIVIDGQDGHWRDALHQKLFPDALLSRP